MLYYFVCLATSISLQATQYCDYIFLPTCDIVHVCWLVIHFKAHILCKQTCLPLSYLCAVDLAYTSCMIMVYFHFHCVSCLFLQFSKMSWNYDPLLWSVLPVINTGTYLVVVNHVQFSAFAWNTHLAITGDWQGGRHIDFLCTLLSGLIYRKCVHVLMYMIEDISLSPGNWGFHRGCYQFYVVMYHLRTMCIGELFYRVTVPVLIWSHNVRGTLVSWLPICFSW